MQKKILVPDIGSYTNVPVIEILVKPGDTIQVDSSLVTLETEKATMEVPSPFAGVVKEVSVSVGSKVSKGDLLLTVEVEGEEAGAKEAAGKESAGKETAGKETQEAKTKEMAGKETQDSKAKEGAAKETTEQKPKGSETEARKDTGAVQEKAGRETTAIASQTTEPGQPTEVHAGPSVRRLAREFGVDLTLVQGTGIKGRIQTSDLQRYVKQIMANAQTGTAGAGAQATGGLGFNLPPMPSLDFSQFGPTLEQPLSRIKKLSGGFLHRNWISVPHITQFDEADITELEAFRKEHQSLAEKQGFKLTPLVFIMKAVVGSLKAFPNFNASLDSQNGNLIIKQYYHIGVAVDTPNGLVVPVVRNVDQKGLFQLAQELAEISQRARKGQLSGADMQGSSFSISSLGGIGGTGFTPIVNLPDVAILGVSKAAIKPVFQDQEFKPRLLLPLALSYDHRVIDGAEGARFITFLSQQLADIRRLLL